MESMHAKSHIRLVADLANRPAAQTPRRAIG